MNRENEPTLMNSEIWGRALVAVVGAVLANLAVLAVGLVTVGAGGFDPFAVPPVAIASAVGALGGVVVYVMFARLFGDAADRRFVIVAVIGTGLSFVTLQQAATFDGATTARLAFLGAMHVVAAAVVVVALVGWRRPE